MSEKRTVAFSDTAPAAANATVPAASQFDEDEFWEKVIVATVAAEKAYAEKIGAIAETTTAAPSSISPPLEAADASSNTFPLISVAGTVADKVSAAKSKNALAPKVKRRRRKK
jgi:hypothetical protein